LKLVVVLNTTTSQTSFVEQKEMDAKELERKRAELERQVELAQQLAQDSQLPATQSPELERLPAAAPASNSSLSGQVLRLVLIGILALIVFTVVYRVVMTIVTLVVVAVLVVGVVVLVRGMVGRD
jgi:Flp pilus assembly protein TadB